MSPFHHPALLYRDSHDFLAGTTGFVHDALDAGEPVLVAVPGARLDRLRAALAAVADRVAFTDALCDLLRVHAGRSGTSVRLQMSVTA